MDNVNKWQYTHTWNYSKFIFPTGNIVFVAHPFSSSTWWLTAASVWEQPICSMLLGLMFSPLLLLRDHVNEWRWHWSIDIEATEADRDRRHAYWLYFGGSSWRWYLLHLYMARFVHTIPIWISQWLFASWNVSAPSASLSESTIFSDDDNLQNFSSQTLRLGINDWLTCHTDSWMNALFGLSAIAVYNLATGCYGWPRLSDKNRRTHFDWRRRVK